MVVDPALGVRGGARAGAGLIDDVARGVGSGLRGARAESSGTGQLHHAVSQTVYRALQEHPNLAGQYSARDSRFVTRAVDYEAHHGYQQWHRELDREVASWVRTHPKATSSEFEAYLELRYAQPDLSTRFCNSF
jgi:hypothetical protein